MTLSRLSSFLRIGRASNEAPAESQVLREFQREFYLRTNKDVAESGVDPFEHFMEQGWRQGRDPSPNFSTSYYLSAYPDVASVGCNPLTHWVLHGRAEGRKARPEDAFTPAERLALGLSDTEMREIRTAFDPGFYLRTNADLAAGNVEPFRHFMIQGWHEKRDPTPAFSTQGYLDDNPDIAQGGINPFTHWVLHGRAEQRPVRGSATTAAPLPDVSPDELSAHFAAADVEQMRGFFDEGFYLANNADIAQGGIDPFAHYLLHGWREGRDPSPGFSTSYYASNYPELRDGGVHLFWHYVLHGRHEKRDPAPYHLVRRRSYEPLVTVIVPNFNHSAYLPQRIASIREQTYRNIELIVLDDKSSDNSIAVIEQLIADLPFPVRTAFNEVNSGNVFRQWEKGFSLASGELIWICESDDFCEPTFLEGLVPHFADHAVMLGFGKIQFCDREGNRLEGMDGFRERAEPGIWHSPQVRPAAQWFAQALSISNVMSNVGGCMFRNQPVPKETWDEAKRYRIAGDWYLYSQLANGGKIAFEPSSVAYFRQHGSNTSASNFDKMYYFEEHERIYENNCSLWAVPDETRQRFIASVEEQWLRIGMEARHGSFRDNFPGYFDAPPARTRRHIVLGTLGFIPGGGEMFPIHLANALLSRGHAVSLLAFSMADANEEMLAMRDPRLAVYDVGSVHRQGARAFLEQCGASLVHTHMISLDGLFFGGPEPLTRFPYVVSLHGSHDAVAFDKSTLLFNMLRGVSHWVYTADRNMELLDGIPLDPGAVSKIPNAVPRDERDFPRTREEMGIDPDAVVFTLVARGIQQKGWRAAVSAFDRLRRDVPDLNAHLLLVGTGPKTDETRRNHESRPDVTFLGFQSCINGIYRLSDCAIMPTRFAGESFPLCLIQALQEDLPLIATDIGEIRSMMNSNGLSAGILLKNERSSSSFFDSLSKAMREMLDPELRERYKKDASILARKFEMDALVANYENVYDKAIDRVARDTPTWRLSSDA